MNDKLLAIIERVYKEGNISLNEYKLLKDSLMKVVLTRYTLDNTNTTWEPYKEIKVK